jgi:hypothetical protein
MTWSRETRLKFANFLIVIGVLLVLSFFGMAFGAPLAAWGIDLRRQLRKEDEAEPSAQGPTSANQAV